MKKNAPFPPMTKILVIPFVIPMMFALCMMPGCMLPGCSDSISKHDNEYLVKVGNNVITVHDFNMALEIAKTAYSHNAIKDPKIAKAIRLRLYNQMVEEILLKSKGTELNINVSDMELENAVSDIKSDFPDGTFEQTLLENAVSYDVWKERIKTRLLMEKIISNQLENKIEITPEDIAKYYEEYYKGKEIEPETDNREINEMIIKNLRKKKTEELYSIWIDKIKSQYKVERNSKEWERIIGM
ncbi:MAG: hypothetical protein HOD17_01430 [Desulfobacteraceae bacterium]|nr:hypothetical protein [Desulfobacteraceae bacterium]